MRRQKSGYKEREQHTLNFNWTDAPGVVVALENTRERSQEQKNVKMRTALNSPKTCRDSQGWSSIVNLNHIERQSRHLGQLTRLAFHQLNPQAFAMISNQQRVG